MSGDLESTSLAQRIVLCSLEEFERAGQTPVNSAELREATTDLLENRDSGAVGRLTEADVMRALNALTETGVVEERRPDDRSPAGKGRPEYSLLVDADELRVALAEDDRVAPLVERD
jgi:Cdc6-like AAA superfamily ATPase